MTDFTVQPLTPSNWEDLVTVFGGGEGKGDCGRCWCMWWRAPRATTVGAGMGKHNKALFHDRVLKGPPPGLVGYNDGSPVGWVQIGPRADVPEWNVSGRLTAPLEPAEAEDPGMWGISCFVVRAGHRKRSFGTALLRAAVNYAVQEGAKAVDACPVDTQGNASANALYHGVASSFLCEGFEEVARRRPNRPLLRRVLHP